MYAAVAAGIHPNTQAAIKAMGNGFDKVFEPIAGNVPIYKKLYQEYLEFGKLIEGWGKRDEG